MRPLNQALPGALTELLRTAPLSHGKVAFAWRATVGAAMERVTTVRLVGDRLVVDASTPEWRREVARSSALILSRMQTLLGADAIASIAVNAPTDGRRTGQ